MLSQSRPNQQVIRTSNYQWPNDNYCNCAVCAGVRWGEVRIIVGMISVSTCRILLHQPSLSAISLIVAINSHSPQFGLSPPPPFPIPPAPAGNMVDMIAQPALST